jgi:hypothetical protein
MNRMQAGWPVIALIKRWRQARKLEVQEGFTSALEKVRDLNVKLIEMAQGEHCCGVRLRARSCGIKPRPM